MLNKIDFTKPSFLLLALPYLGFNWSELVHSPFYTSTKILVVFSILLVCEIAIRLSFHYFKKYEKPMAAILLTVSLVFFYGFYLISFSENHQLLQYKDHFIRGRFILITLAVILFSMLLFRKKTSFLALNIFLVFFTVFSFYASPTNQKISIQNHPSILKPQVDSHSITKPVLLIITDEYHSPDELYTVTGDSTIYQFAHYLKQNHWLLRTNSYSHETSTIHSLSSLFNFNLSLDTNYQKSSINQLGLYRLMQAAISDSFTKKQVEIINFGIFDIGKSKPLHRLYYYPKNFAEQLLQNTAFQTALNNTNGLTLSGLETSFYPMEEHNRYLFNTVSDSLSKITNPRTFIYIHLYMPHSPLVFEPAFKLRANNLKNYIAYWNFTNSKLQILLAALTKENKYRIILTGDHGYRGDARVNPHHSFTAFYGFDASAIEHIPSVQDFGSLINSYF